MAIIPRYGDWVTFPLEQLSAVELEWWSDRTQQRARYYVDKCWFGDRVDRKDDPEAYAKGLKPKGESIIFIAAEYIESRMQGAPHLHNLHLADRMRGKYNKDDPANRWALLQLNDMFHYGQNNKQSFRWIVYHPPAIAGRERKIYQHRFVGNVSLVIADIGIELAGVAINSGVQAASGGNAQAEGVVPILSRIKDFFAANKGHYLHQFSATAESLSAPPPQQQQKQQQQQQQQNQALDPTSMTLPNDTQAVIQAIPSELPAVDYNEKNDIILEDITVEDITYEYQPPADVSFPKRRGPYLARPLGIKDLAHSRPSERQSLSIPIRARPALRAPKAQLSCD